MPSRLPQDLVDEVLARYPLPIADAVAALEAAENLHEQRDRVVEVFRAVLRTLAGFALAVRVQYGSGPGETPAQVDTLLQTLRRRSLTDGQWRGLLRDLLKPWRTAPDSYPLPGLVELLHGKRTPLNPVLDGLLAMRKEETVAHGASGAPKELLPILEERMPELQTLLELLAPLWEQRRLVLPLTPPAGSEERQRAWSLVGDTPGRGRWRRLDLHPDARIPAGEAVLIDAEARPVVALHPLVQVLRPTPEAVEECFFLDGHHKRGARLLAIPSMAEFCQAEVWDALDEVLAEGQEHKRADHIDRPFLGLASFGPEDQDRFFGRETLSEELANRIRRHPLVTVTGPSGCGKTSLLQASALPSLTEHDVLTLRPGPYPLQALAGVLGPRLSAACDGADPMDLLRRTPHAVGAAMTRACRERGHGLVLVVDQGEELLTLCREPEAQHAFAAAIASMAADPQGPLRVVYSLREDFFGRLATLAPLRGLYTRQVAVITTPDREALLRTLLGPLHQVDHSFESLDLAEAMVDAVVGEPAALALLQFCADRLWDARDRAWKRLTWEAYRGLGGVEGALAMHADRVLDDMPPAQQQEARQILLRLVTEEDTRAISTRRELLEVAEDAESAARVLERLVSARILVTGEDDAAGEGGRVELVHEALIKHWDRLRQWLAEEREGRRTLLALRHAAREWDARGRPRGLLWRASVLEEYRVWRRHSSVRLTALESAFAAASHAEEVRGARLRRRLVMGTMAVLALFTGFMWTQWQAAVVAQERAEQQQWRAEAGRLHAAARLNESKGRAHHAVASWRAAVAHGDDGTFDADGELRQRVAQVIGKVLTGHEDVVRSVAFSPDGTTLATGSADGTSILWDVDTGTPRHTLTGHESGVTTVAFSPDGKTLATGSWDNTSILWDVDTGTPRHTLTGHESPVLDGAFSPDGKTLATGSWDNTSILWDVDTGTPRHTLTGHEDVVRSVAFSPDGKTLATGSWDNTSILWDVDTGTPRHTLTGHDYKVETVAFSPDGKTLATGSWDNTSILWDVDTGTPRHTLTGHDYKVETVAFSPDGKTLATGSWDNTSILWDVDTGTPRHTLILWDVDTGTPRHTLTGHEDVVRSVAFSPDGKTLATGSADGTSILWDVDTGTRRHTLTGHDYTVETVAFSPDGKTLATGAEDGTSILWDVDTGTRRHTLTGHESPVLDGAFSPDGHESGVTTVAFSPDGKTLATGSWDNTSILWDVDTGTRRYTLTGHEDVVRSVAFSPDGKTLATGSWDNTSILWDVDTGTPRHTLTGHDYNVETVAFSPDGKTLATGSWDNTSILWDVDTGTPRHTLTGHEDVVRSVAFSPDGKTLATGSWDNTSILWDVDTGTPRHTLTGHDYKVETVAFSPDGKTLATGSWDNTSILWDVDTGTPRHTLTGHDYKVETVAFSPDGKTLATGSWDNTSILWDVDTGTRRYTLTGHESGVETVAFSPDGNTLATGAEDATTILWNVATGTRRHTLKGHEDGVIAVAFSPDGNTLATGAGDGTAILWSTHPVTWSTDQVLADTGRRTNLRVCRDTLKIVPILPFPPPETVWVEEVLPAEEAAARCAL